MEKLLLSLYTKAETGIKLTESSALFLFLILKKNDIKYTKILSIA